MIHPLDVFVLFQNLITLFSESPKAGVCFETVGARNLM